MPFFDSEDQELLSNAEFLNTAHKTYRLTPERKPGWLLPYVMMKNVPINCVTAHVKAQGIVAIADYLATKKEFIEKLEVLPDRALGHLTAEDVVRVLEGYAGSGILSLRELKIDCGKQLPSSIEEQDVISEILAKVFFAARLVEFETKFLPFSANRLLELSNALPKTLTRFKISGELEDSCMRLLCGALESEDCRITEVSLDNVTVSGSAAKLLALAMSRSLSVAHLKIFSADLTDEFALILADALKTSNRTLKQLNIDQSVFSEECGLAFAEVLATNRTLVTMQLGKCKAGEQAYHLLVDAITNDSSLVTIIDFEFHWGEDVTSVQASLINAFKFYRRMRPKTWHERFLRASQHVRNGKKWDRFVFRGEYDFDESDCMLDTHHLLRERKDHTQMILWNKWKTQANLMMDPRVFDSPLIDGNRVYRAEKYLPTPLTRVELDFLKLASAIRNMPGWNIKATHPEVLEKWKDEAKGQGFFQNIVERTIEEICMDAQTVNELERRNVELGRDVPIPVPHALDMVYGVFGSSSIPVVREQLRSKLIAEIKVLEDVPDKDKDWHPGSNYQVLDLIHPSLFPLVFGKTGGLTPSQVEAKLPWDQLLGSGEVTNVPIPYDSGRDKPIEWKKFQWLPSEIFVNEDYSSNVRSYISNLHPHAHSDLYRTIETIFGRFVPLFEAVLTDFLHWPYPLKPRIVLTSPDEFYDGGDKAFREWEHEHCENNAPDPLPVRTHLIPKSEVPRPRAHWISDPEDVMRFNLRDRSLQVIVKAANIHLTPEDPKYPGGVWHIEGMAHEAIVATGIYYYDIENISVSQLGFRMAVSAESVHYFQYDHNGMFQMYGLKDEGTSNQVWGHVEAIEGLCVAFSNVYQHRVYPFELADKTKPGHRKILVFFLVNPNLRVSSTADIPPQQMDWYWREVEAIRDGKKGRSMLERLPAEVLQLVRKILEAMPQSERKVFTTHEAIKIRKKLMAERKYERDEITQEVFERAVNLCEH